MFFVKDGKLHTPIADCFLDGITRRTVIGLAKKRGIEVIERRIGPEELSDFEQCFLTGSAAEVTPVSEIGQYRFTPGEITKDADGRLQRQRPPEARRRGIGGFTRCANAQPTAKPTIAGQVCFARSRAFDGNLPSRRYNQLDCFGSLVAQ